MTTERLRVVVLGYIVRGPLGGFAWHHMQYVMGLAKLGHDVIFVEESGDDPSCYNPDLSTNDADPSYGLRFIEDAFAGCGIGDKWAYFDAPSSHWYGPRAASVIDYCANADLLINLCDPETLSPWLLEIPVRAMVDTDPLFSQVQIIHDPVVRAAVEQHTVFFSFGENIASGLSSVPSDGFAWLPTRQPIDLDAWKPVPPNPAGRWTTIMQWDSYPGVEHLGIRYGMKSDSFTTYLDLPQHTESEIEIALGSPSAPRALLEAKGWHLRNPLDPSRTPWAYRDYITASTGELAVAKHGYVASRSGWFSERSACYLASGRPVVVQETGFSDVLQPVGEGLIPFSTIDEAVAGIEVVERDYNRHSHAARALAEEWFDSSKVLSDLITEAMGTVS